MKTRTLAAAFLLTLAPGVFCPPAFAQQGAEDPTTTMARARFKEGVEYYDKGEYELARAAFLQAYALKKHPAVLLNLAWSSLKSGHTLEAKRYFEQFLAEGKDITDKQRNDANDGLSQARAKLGRIEIQAAAGTDVTVDGDHVGTAPLADPVAVEPGAHTVKFKGTDGTSDTQSVSVLAGQKAIARFGTTGGTTAATTPEPPAGSTGPSNSESTSSPPAPTPEQQEGTPPSEAPKSPVGAESHASIFAAPKNPTPAIALLVAGGVGIAGSVVLYFFKQSAQNNANNVASEIVGHGGGPGTCTNPTSTFAGPCSTYQSDNNDVNTDATIANIALGVGIAAIVGAGIYWIASDKDTGGAASTRPVLAPTVGRSSGGLSLTGGF